MSNEFVLGVGPAEKIQGALRRNASKLSGREISILEWLATGNNVVKIDDVILGRSEIKVVSHTVDLDSAPFIPNGWSVEKNEDGSMCHKKGGQFKFDPTKISLHLDEGQKKGKTIEGNKLRKKLEGLNCSNANLLDFYLAHTDLIPEDWKGKAIFFWGTIYRRADDNLCIRYLGWRGDGWRWHFYWLDGDWGDNYPAVVLGPK